jgi:hypothetical protein
LRKIAASSCLGGSQGQKSSYASIMIFDFENLDMKKA